MTHPGEDPVNAISTTRTLRRSRGRWRIIAFVILALAIVLAFARFSPVFTSTGGDRIARVEISGTITTDRQRSRTLARLAEDASVRGVLLAINSPGGTTAGGEELYEDIRRLSLEKPVVAVIAETGASAAYMTAIAADHIVSRRLSIVGSIGVLYRHVDAGRLLDTIGIDLDKIASGELKAEPEFDGPIAPEVRASLAALVEDSYAWFVDIVAERRALERAEILGVADGRVMTGSMGVEAGLIDAVGGEAEARAWLEETHEIDPELEIVTAYPPASRTGWLREALTGAAAAVGLADEKGLALDGLVSLWHP
ncbi:signal peptide peptidase SppA [Pelagibacterium montanilacus]|uniref:signal peptide peptidase SppA n=1 Tax=Pelagibacterium montanilacus TaxID=2185280 RepID=UPI000F8E6ABC|nr:signal peptide peptidase SppA [Pelagibacterium montanilacus]